MTKRNTQWNWAAALAMLLSCWLAFPVLAQQQPPPMAPPPPPPEQAPQQLPGQQQVQQPAPEAELPPPPQSRIEGAIYDALGQPVAGARVIGRQADGVEAYVSSPSDDEGKYALSVPAGGAYVIVALISAAGGRVPLPESEPLRVGAAALEHDLQLSIALGPEPRKNGVDTGGAERLFLSFVEDPALVDDPYLEGRVDFADYGSVDTIGIDLIVAAQFRALPRIEWGLAGGFANVNRSGGTNDSGVRDLDAWGKFAFYRSANQRTDLAFGALLTFPTGDHESGLGHDTLQSKLFFTGSYSFQHLALIGSVGVRATGGGSVAGIPLEGTVSGAAAIGVLLPLWSTITLTTELDYQGERFDNFGRQSRVAFGIDWRILPRGVFRGAVIGGLVDESADARILAGFGYSF